MNIHEAIAQLTQDFDSKTVGDLIAQFFTDTPARIATLGEAQARGDLATLARAAHSIVGSSSAFGLEELRSAARTLEESAEAGNTAVFSAQIAAVKEAYDQAVPALQRILQQ